MRIKLDSKFGFGKREIGRLFSKKKKKPFRFPIYLTSLESFSQVKIGSILKSKLCSNFSITYKIGVSTKGATYMELNLNKT